MSRKKKSVTPDQSGVSMTLDTKLAMNVYIRQKASSREIVSGAKTADTLLEVAKAEGIGLNEITFRSVFRGLKGHFVKKANQSRPLPAKPVPSRRRKRRKPRSKRPLTRQSFLREVVGQEEFRSPPTPERVQELVASANQRGCQWTAEQLYASWCAERSRLKRTGAFIAPNTGAQSATSSRAQVSPKSLKPFQIGEVGAFLGRVLKKEQLDQKWSREKAQPLVDLAAQQGFKTSVEQILGGIAGLAIKRRRALLEPKTASEIRDRVVILTENLISDLEELQTWLPKLIDSHRLLEADNRKLQRDADFLAEIRKMIDP